MKIHKLILNQEPRLKTKRILGNPKPRAEKLNEIYTIDMTKIKLEHEK